MTNDMEMENRVRRLEAIVSVISEYNAELHYQIDKLLEERKI